MIIENLMVIIFLGILGVLDVLAYNKDRGYIPSIITSTYILMALLIGGPGAIYGGLIALCIAFILNDFELWGGWADFKIYLGTCIIIGSLYPVLIFTLILTMIAFVYKFIAAKIYKADVIPFIPAFFVAYSLFLLITLI